MARHIRFGPFELDQQTGELWKHGTKVKLQGKPCQILIALLEQPGEPVSREALQQRLWSGDTFVDFERGLNTAANRLRLALGDSAENPRYVETLARSGYRFVAQVEESVEASPVPVPAPPPAQARRLGWLIPIAVAALVISIVGWALRLPVPEKPTFQQITFGSGFVARARFAPDAQTILYSAKWESDTSHLYLVSSVSPETRTLEFRDLTLSAVSRSGELALLSREERGANSGSTLYRVPLNGGSPLAVADHVVCAEWSPDGKDLAVVRFAGRRSQLEFPIGKILYQAASQFGCPRFSPNGNGIALPEYPVRGDAEIKEIDLTGQVRTLSGGWPAASGLAWNPINQELWFTASRTGGAQAIWAVSTSGKLRLVYQAPGSLRLEDISPEGHVLVTELDRRVEMAGRVGKDTAEKDLSWFDFSAPEDFSADGNLILFDEAGQGGGPNGTVYLRRISDNATLRLAEGHALALAPDGHSAVVLNVNDRQHLLIVPVGEGKKRQIFGGGLEYRWARFFPDGRKLLVGGSKPGGNLTLFVQSIQGGKAQPLAPQTYLRNVAISPDGKSLAGNDPDNRLVIMAVESGEPKPVEAQPYGVAVGWNADGSALFVRDRGVPSLDVYRVDLASGRSKLWNKIQPISPIGIQSLNHLFYARDEKSYVYSPTRTLAKMYLTTDLR
jgi:DNA-binding winged helix-turn-helix (wHTH) protein/Tol biopolymer transport system component